MLDNLLNNVSASIHGDHFLDYRLVAHLDRDGLLHDLLCDAIVVLKFSKLTLQRQILLHQSLALFLLIQDIFEIKFSNHIKVAVKLLVFLL